MKDMGRPIDATKYGQMKTRSKQVANTVSFQHQYIATPRVTKADTIVAVATKLTQVLQEETETNIGATEKQKLKQLAEVFQTVATNRGRKTKSTLKQCNCRNEGGKHKHHTIDAKTTEQQRGTNHKRTHQHETCLQGQGCCVTK